MEFKEHCSSRWIMLIAGAFWAPAIAATYYLMHKQLFKEKLGLIIFGTASMLYCYLPQLYC